MSALEGLVISHLGKSIAVESASGETVLCQALRKLETVAVGDKVLFSFSAKGQGRIEAVLPRRSLLIRPSRGGKTRPVAANLDQVLVIFATEPECDFLLIDQYLAVCENHHIVPILIFNKQDLPTNETIEKELPIYHDLGYKIHKVSAIQGYGLDELKILLKNNLSILVGQSGVGKSSLTNTLLPKFNLKTSEVSATKKHGCHTTTAATLYHLPTGGDLIDSPGVAIFGLADLDEQQLAYGYKEFQAVIPECRFHNCRHQNDKGCAIRKAVEEGQIADSRYLRFLKLLAKLPNR